MSMSWALSLAPVGAWCMVPGFEAWNRIAEGWFNPQSGVTLTTAELASNIEAMADPEPEGATS